MTIAEFYNEAGETIFREREINILHQVSRYHEAVISFGGNFPMNVDTYRILHRNGDIVALSSEPYRVEERVGRHIGKRPTVDYDDLHNFVRTMMKQWEVDTIVEAIHKEKIQFAKRDRGGKTHEH